MNTKLIDSIGRIPSSGNRPLQAAKPSRWAQLFGRRAEQYRQAPPMRNPQYIGVHIAAASRSALWRSSH